MKISSGGTRPSNFVVFAFVVVAIVLVWFVFFTDHHSHRSPDQQILIDKSKH
jgi:hypothetical protein